MSCKNIADYGVIGNGLTLGLVGIDGSVDWMCFPYMDSPSVFAAVLDDKKGGRFAVRPTVDFDSVQNYLPRTNVLQTIFRTTDGETELSHLNGHKSSAPVHIGQFNVGQHQHDHHSG